MRETFLVQQFSIEVCIGKIVLFETERFDIRWNMIIFTLPEQRTLMVSVSSDVTLFCFSFQLCAWGSDEGELRPFGTHDAGPSGNVNAWTRDTGELACFDVAPDELPTPRHGSTGEKFISGGFGWLGHEPLPRRWRISFPPNLFVFFFFWNPCPDIRPV